MKNSYVARSFFRFKLFIQEFLFPRNRRSLSFSIISRITHRVVNFSRNTEPTVTRFLSFHLGSISNLLQSSQQSPRKIAFRIDYLLSSGIPLFLLSRIHTFFPRAIKRFAYVLGACVGSLKNPEQLFYECRNRHGWLTKGIFSIIPRGVSSRWNSPRLTSASCSKSIKGACSPTSKTV